MWNSAGSYTGEGLEICSDDRNEEDGCAFDCGGGSPRTCLEDDEGFPSFQLLGMDVGGGESAEDDGDSFASSFYRGGADWSCLQTEREEEQDKVARHVTPLMERKLKQASLLQVWGLKIKEVDGGLKRKEIDGGLKQTNLLQLWGLKKKEVDGGPCGASSASSLPTQALIKKKKNGGAAETRTRACPFYKKMPGTPFTVDAFRYGCVEGCSAYFLTHFHADHYGGLSKGWSHGPIYCSPITARLVRICLYVNPSFIRPLELNEEHVIEGVRVTLLDANHCPGAALIHFGLANGQCYLHTGDFRASKLMQEYAILAKHRVNLLYLDTTYCNPRYKFPAKDDVLNYVTRITKSYLKKQPKTLVVVGAYSIGKESVYLAISKALGVQIHANASRRRILQSFEWPELSKRITSNPKDTFLHVLPMSSLRFENLTAYLKTYNNQYVGILAFRPTGWTFSETVGNDLDRIKPNSRGNITIYGVPYSEHSSFTEMQEFVKFLKPDKVIPTVNVGNASSREKMESHFREWLKKG